MYIDKIIKREVILLLVFVSILLIILFSFTYMSYSSFFSVDEGETNTINIGNLEVTFCADETCNAGYENMGQIIGTTTINGEIIPNSIYPYESKEEALTTTPYVFNIKNTGDLTSYLNIKLFEDKEYIPSIEYSNYESITNKYADYIKIAINDCEGTYTEDLTYSSLQDGLILENDLLEPNQDKTYCLWTWLDKTTPNEAQSTYFVANLDFVAEYKPINYEENYE